jgi:ketosteroid isomerase-like protein
MPTRDQNEAEIREILARWIEGLRAHDLDRMMASYETCVIAFDATPPLQYVGIDAYRETWRSWLDTLEGPVGYELRELAVCAGDDVAFTHGLVHMAATQKSGRRGDAWLRWTAGWKKIDGAWLVVHEHVSAPFEIETNRAVLDARP